MTAKRSQPKSLLPETIKIWFVTGIILGLALAGAENKWISFKEKKQTRVQTDRSLETSIIIYKVKAKMLY